MGAAIAEVATPLRPTFPAEGYPSAMAGHPALATAHGASAVVRDQDWWTAVEGAAARRDDAAGDRRTCDLAFVFASLVSVLPATTGPASGSGGSPLPLGAIIGVLVIFGLSYAVAIVVAAHRHTLGTGRDEIRTEPGLLSSTISVRAALSWLADGPARRSVVLTGAAGRHAMIEPSADGVTLTGFDGTASLAPRDVGLIIADSHARALLATDLERLVGGMTAPIVSTFERVS